MIPCVCGKKFIASQCYDVIFVLTKGHDHILMIDDKKVTEATWKDILCSPERSQHCVALLG